MNLHRLQTSIAPPERFTYPFCYEPHPLCRLAAEEVKRHLQGMTLTEGKMFGVLVVEHPDGGLAFLAAYSGLLEGRNDWPYFVPPAFAIQRPNGHSRSESQQLQLQIFHQYRLLNARGEEKDLVEIWQDYHCSPRIRRRYPLPPGGTGDCCAPKLLQHAYRQGLKPLCMAEFWQGDSPRSDIRQHDVFYPACRGKCKPVLTWMLQGLDTDPNPEEAGFPHLGIGEVYRDDDILVLNKPSGLLSIPGRTEDYSVSTILQERYPGSLLVHRLDMGTSGLMLCGLNHAAATHLQRQFEERTIKKRYIALLDGLVGQEHGKIDLPLLCDPINRPRQVVDFRHGKRAITEYRVLQTFPDTQQLGHSGQFTLIHLFPHTGRTHQLRIHCAHPEGLACPILGDELYGFQADRLYLHADRITFVHPTKNRTMHFELPNPFSNLCPQNNK